MAEPKLPRVVVAAPASGSGKTTVTVALLGALQARGLQPAACKCGPDYIDPMFHRTVLGIAGDNIDLFFSSREQAEAILARQAAYAGIAVLEGAMGYYDGIADTAEASAWRIAEATSSPTLLVVQPRGAFLSLAALVNGFRRFRPDSRICGLVLNRCSAAMYDKYRNMLEKETSLRLYGFLPDLPEAHFASRHLGLVTPSDIEEIRKKVALLACQAEKNLDIDGIVKLAENAPALAVSESAAPALPLQRARIAVARDKAFCFYYQENLRQLEQAGAKLVFFSPLADAALPPNIGGLYLGGGYPELHAERLAANAELRRDVENRVALGLPTVAECGGFLYLLEKLADNRGQTWPMCGCIGGQAANSGKLGRFGYITLQARHDTFLLAQGEEIKAHEFHYWDSDASGTACFASKPGGRTWQCVNATANVFAGFPHLYFASNSNFVRRFVEAAAEFTLRMEPT